MRLALVPVSHRIEIIGSVVSVPVLVDAQCMEKLPREAHMRFLQQLVEGAGAGKDESARLFSKEHAEMKFDLPPGEYPYLCSFPGHWMLMKGEMIVE